MNKFETKTLLLNLSYDFEVIDLITKTHINDMRFEIENCFVFFKHKDLFFIIWEKFKTPSINHTDLDFHEKTLSTKMTLKNTIGFLERSIFTNELVTTGDVKMYKAQNIASALFDQLNSLSQLGLINDNFQSYHVGLNFELLKEKVSSFDLDKEDSLFIYTEILKQYGFDCATTPGSLN